jgi:hypothetical protein
MLALSGVWLMLLTGIGMRAYLALRELEDRCEIRSQGPGQKRRMSLAVKQTCEIVRRLRREGRPWLEIQDELERSGIRQGDFRPLYMGCENAPYRLRFIPKH